MDGKKVSSEKQAGGQGIRRRALSAKARGCRAKSGCATGETADEDRASSRAITPARLRWSTLIRKVYEVDPLICPKCGGNMRIVAFIDDPPRTGEVPQSDRDVANGRPDGRPEDSRPSGSVSLLRHGSSPGLPARIAYIQTLYG